MYVCKFGSGKNIYVRVMESYRDEKGKPRSRVVEHLGRYDDLGEAGFQKLCDKYQKESQDKKRATQQRRRDQLQKLISASPSQENDHPLPLLRYGHYVLKQLWEKDLALDRKIRYEQKVHTKVRYDINAALSYMTFMKVLDPASVLYRYDDKDNFIGAPAESLGLHHLYSSLDFAKFAKDDLMGWVNRQLDKQFGKTRASLVFYDVTNAYFESPLTDAERGLEQDDFIENLYEMAHKTRDAGQINADCFDEDGCLIAERLPPDFIESVADEKIQFLKMRGPSKEHRFDLPIVSIALVVDSLGLPMDFAVYAGNESEFKSMSKSIEAFKQKYDIQDVTVSADRGINSVKNLKMLHDEGLGFLVAQKVTQFSKEINDKMFNRSLYTAFDPDNPQAGGYQVVENWTKQGKSKEESVTCTLVLTYNEKRRARDKAILDLWRAMVQKKVAKGEKLGPRKTGWAALADIGAEQDKPILGVNEKVYEQKLKLCGYAALVYEPPKKGEGSKQTAKQLSAAEVAFAYKRQCHIEDCFRIMKSHIGLRPMYVWTSDHVRGHVTICVLALLLVRLLQHKLQQQGIQMSVREISKALSGATVAAIDDGKDDVMFLSCEHRASLRKGREQLSTQELIDEVKQGRLRIRGIRELMQVVGLEPLPRVCNRAELARCLKTRFFKPSDAVPELILETM